jgi:hypothetical protein
MLDIISHDLHKQYEHVNTYIMIQGLHGMFENQARAKGYNKGPEKITRGGEWELIKIPL